jgi:hypothetical protein
MILLFTLRRQSILPPCYDIQTLVEYILTILEIVYVVVVQLSRLNTPENMNRGYQFILISHTEYLDYKILILLLEKQVHGVRGK